MTDTTNPGILKLRPLLASTILWLMVVFVMLIAIKCYWVFHPMGPVVFPDEFRYKESAQQIFNRQPYNCGGGAHYPPLYSVSLSLALLSKEYWYEWMLFINALISSSLIFPVYLMSKRLLPPKLSFLPVIMTALLPFHAVYPSLLMSENLFLVLFLWALYFSLIREKRNWFSGAMVGALCACAYMTKYLFLPCIPLLIGLWWLIPLLKGDLKGQRLWQKLQLPALAAVMAGFLIAYFPWLLYAHYSGVSGAGEAMGLVAAVGYREAIASAEIRFSGARTNSPNLNSLLLWFTVYGSYMVLVLAPVLSILCLYFRVLFSKKENIPFREKLFFFSLMVLSIGYFLLAVQHSWGAGYNYPEPQRLLGRYLMHLTPLYLLAAIIALYRISDHISSMRTAFIIPTSLFSLVLVYGAQHILYEQAVWKLPPWFADSTFNSPDSFLYMYRVILWAVLTIILLIGISLIAGRINKVFAARYMLPFVAGLMILLQLRAFNIASARSMNRSSLAIHGRLLAPVFKTDLSKGVKSIALKYDIPGLNDRNLLWSLDFWGIPESSIMMNAMTERTEAIPAAAKQYFLSSMSFDDKPVYAYNDGDIRYYLYNLNWDKIHISAPMLLDFGPHSTKAGKGFNIQSSGQSALWFRTRYATAATVVVFNNNELETTVGNESSVSAIIPDKLLKTPGEYTVFLLDKSQGIRSNSVVFRVE
jgi:hypothetical protein